ncbi:hypothetical protein ACJMK2_031578 [Sinanodonta woodiana]|uniref:Uncharacterized protein n=1 Tax=Sinanodonta woodiana TaxID=1069815 RepID=A0ABD3WZ80_SINWO
MDSEENATSCPVCRRIYCDPRSLSCGHSFCLNCLKGVAGNNRRFRCPLCRFEVNLRYTNVDQLPKNFVLCSVIEARDKKKPSMCLDHKKSFDFFCQRCDVVICSKCLTMQHKGHAIEDIEIIYSERNKNIDSISNTVDNTFKKWNDALEKQHNAICSYLHQERERKKQVFSEAERMIADSMTTVTGLETEISKLRSKDTAFVVQVFVHVLWMT